MTLTITALASYGAMSNAERVRAGLPRAQRLSDRNEWFRIANAAGENGAAARLDLFDEIGFWGVTAADFNKQLQAVTADAIELHVNSPGGDVFDGIAILNSLRSHPANISVIVDGLAASAASFIAMAGDSVTMMPNATMMIHNASGLCMGDDDAMTAMAELLNKVSDNIASVYASRAGGTAADWRATMRGEQWYDADEAVAAGLADKVAEPPAKKKPAPSAEWNLSFYAYSGRDKAPAPAAPPAAAVPAAQPKFHLDAAELRAAMTISLEAAK